MLIRRETRVDVPLALLHRRIIVGGLNTGLMDGALLGSSEFSLGFSFLSSQVFADRVQVVMKAFRVHTTNLTYFIHNGVIDHLRPPTILPVCRGLGNQIPHHGRFAQSWGEAMR